MPDKDALIEEFRQRLKELRLQKGISARDMSLSLRRSGSLINQIESARILPSMSFFFEICLFLQITPQEFFSDGAEARTPQNAELVERINALSPEQLQALLQLLRTFTKCPRT